MTTQAQRCNQKNGIPSANRKTCMVLVVIALSLFSCKGDDGDRKLDADREAARKKTAGLIHTLVLQHNANPHWFKVIRRKAYTIELERLILQSKQPLVVLSRIGDVRQTEAGLQIIAWEEFGLRENWYFILECTAAQAAYILKQENSDGHIRPDFAIIFNAYSVERPLDHIISDDESSLIGVAGKIIVKGKCVDLLFLEHYVSLSNIFSEEQQ